MLGRIRTCLPVHPTMRHPRTGEPLRAIGRVRGRLIWPVMGAEDDPPKPDDPKPDPPKPDPPKPDPDDDDPDHLGFPKDTPLSEMTVGQREAYWKHKARKHERTVKERDDYDDLKRKAAEFDKLEKASRTENEQKVEDAKEQARIDVLKKTIPALVRAEMRAAAAGRIEDDKLDAVIEPLDMSKFLNDKGDEVDTDKVKKFIDGIAPTDGKGGGGGRRDLGQGRRGGGGKASGVDAGRELFESKRKSRQEAKT